MQRNFVIKKVKSQTHNTVVIPRADHPISRQAINSYALKILYRLREQGFDAHLVGGGVRDLLLGLHPKDFDIATNAHPEQIRQLFSNSRLIGRRFQIVHVFFGREIVEVTTFRKAETKTEAETLEANEHGILLRDNSFGSIEQDALRRDFTINALYYNIADFSIIDFAAGMGDLKERVIRLIGAPEIRFREDPVRMLRAVRFAGKLDFTLDPAIMAALPTMRSLLTHVASSRLFDEFIKIMKSGQSCAIFQLMLDHDLLTQLMPAIPALWQENAGAEALAKIALISTDERIKAGKPINPAFLLAVLYWPIMCAKQQELEKMGQSKGLAFDSANFFAINLALQHLDIPRRFTNNIREIWYLQRRFIGPKSKRLLQLLALPRFRAGYDFLLLRALIDEKLKPLAEWWTQFYESPEEARLELIKLKPAVMD